MFKNKNLLILVIIMVVNALSYGTIIPLLYPYASRFGIGPLGLSLLFASFSIAQLIATPIIGRLSDKYGRKPLLLFCLLGTSISLALFAGAQSVAMLFIARILDGITGGNMSVAQAVIADTTEGDERAKGFGLLGATFGFGFLIGPAVGGVLSSLGLTVPFWFASALALAGTILGFVIMDETLKPGSISAAKSLGLSPKTIVMSLLVPATGVVLVISFLTAIAQNSFIIGIQSVMVDELKLSTVQSGLIFTLFGLVNIITQMFGVKWVLTKVKSKKMVIIGSLVGSALLMLLMSVTMRYVPFVIVSLLFGVAFSPVFPVITGLLSERTKQEDQGVILGINQSYLSLGQIIGPLIAGAVTQVSGIGTTFVVAAGFFGISLFAGRNLFPTPKAKVDVE